MAFGLDAAIEKVRKLADQWLVDAESTANRIVDRALAKAQERVSNLQIEVKEKE